MTDAPKRIIQIILHDSGRIFGCYGESVKTPNIDRMAAEGVLFENHFSGGTVCIPSRACILTGKYLHHARTCLYETDERTLPRALSDAGYKTARIGFREEKEYNVTGGQYDNQNSGKELMGYDISDTESPAAETVSQKVIRLLDEMKDEPALYIHAAFREAHGGWNQDVSDDEIDAAEYPARLPQMPDIRAGRKVYAKFLKDIATADREIGRILDYIDASGMRGQTLVFFTTDHGIDFPRAKQTCYDAGTGIGLIWWGPSWLNAGSRAAGLSSHVDIYATVCDIANASPASDIDGVSQLNALRDPAYRARDHVFSAVSLDNLRAPVRAYRTEQYKLIVNYKPGWPIPAPNAFCEACGSEVISNIYGAARPAIELYDIVKDPCESDNLAALPEYATVVENLVSCMTKLMSDTDDRLLAEDSPYAEFADTPPVKNWRRKKGGFVFDKTASW